MARDYAYEVLAEVTSTDTGVGRGQLNAALRDIRLQEPDLTDSYALSLEISTRARMYHQVFSGVAITPNALAKHWQRVKEQAPKPSGSNLTAERPSIQPTSNRERNLQEARKVLQMLKANDG